MELSREKALSILGLSPSATDDEAAQAYTRQKKPVKRMLVRADSVDVKNEYRDRLRALVQARDAALGRTKLDDRISRLKLEERPLLKSLAVKALDRSRAFGILGLAEGAGDQEVSAAYTERYRFLTQRLGRAREDKQFRAIRNARARLLGVRRFLLERTGSLDLTAVFANQFEDEIEGAERGPAAETLSAPEPFFEDGPKEPPTPLAESGLEQTKGLTPDDEPFDPEQTRTSLAPEPPDPNEWEGGPDHIRALFEQLVRPLRENMAAAESEELKQGYERAIAELRRKREEALRRHGD